MAEPNRNFNQDEFVRWRELWPRIGGAMVTIQSVAVIIVMYYVSAISDSHEKRFSKSLSDTRSAFRDALSSHAKYPHEGAMPSKEIGLQIKAVNESVSRNSKSIEKVQRSLDMIRWHIKPQVNAMGNQERTTP